MEGNSGNLSLPVQRKRELGILGDGIAYADW